MLIASLQKFGLSTNKTTDFFGEQENIIGKLGMRKRNSLRVFGKTESSVTLKQLIREKFFKATKS